MVRSLDSEFPSGEAMLVVAIDGRKKRKRIVLPQAISEPNRFFSFF
jgi:hypothetical protein